MFLSYRANNADPDPTALRGAVWSGFSRVCTVCHTCLCTVMTLSFRTDRSGQTVRTQIRLLQEEQSDQGFHCLLFRLHLLDKIFFDSVIKH